jgi:bacteriorhodopsin
MTLESAPRGKTLRAKTPVGINYPSDRQVGQMVELAIWYGTGAAALLVGAVAFVAFAVLRGDVGSPYYSLPPLQALFAAVSYAVLALAVLGEVTRVSPGVVRYLGLFLTLPVAVYYLGLLARTSAERRVTAVSLVMVAVVAAYFTTVTAGRLRLGLAGLSGATVLALVWTLVRRFEPTGIESTLFLSLRDLTVAALVAYPVAYLLGPMWTGVLVAGDFGFVHLAVDVVFSLGFLVLVVSRSYELATATSGTPSLG